MKRKTLSVLLVIIMVACFAGALSYPLMYKYQKDSNEADMEDLREMRRSALENSAEPTQTPEPTQSAIVQTENTALPTSGPVETVAAFDDSGEIETEATEAAPEPEFATVEPVATAEPTAEPTEEPVDRMARTWVVLPYPEKEKVLLDDELILPQYREIYKENNDLVGWLYIPNTDIDYPVLQNEDNEYYLHRDFYGNENKNGQLILDSKCDAWTPSYNLVVSGHNMKHGLMFGTLAF